jgi:hypothetical protein
MQQIDWESLEPRRLFGLRAVNHSPYGVAAPAFHAVVLVVPIRPASADDVRADGGVRDPGLGGCLADVEQLGGIGVLARASRILRMAR